MFSTRLLAGLFLLFASGVGAQEVAPAKPVPPPGPLLKKPAAFSKWEIRFSYGEKSTSGSDENAEATSESDTGGVVRIRRATVTFTGPIWHIETVNSKGTKSEVWFDGATALTEDSMGPLILTQEDLDRRDVSIDSSGYPEMAWVGKDTFIGQQEAGGVGYLVFQNGDMMAWVTVENRLPAIWRQGAETRRFRQLAAPTTVLSLPGKIGETSSLLKEAHEAAKRPTLKAAN